MDRYIIDKNGLVVQCPDLMKWARWLENHKFESQLVDTIAGIRVSTVFLGLDHQFGKGEPILWETMIFNDDEAHTIKFGGRDMKCAPDLGQWRFSYKEEAYDFHRHKVAELKSKLAAASSTTANTPTTLI